MKPVSIIILLTGGLIIAACGPTTPPTPSVGAIQTAISETQAAEPSPPPTNISDSEDQPESETATSVPPTLSSIPAQGVTVNGSISVAFLNLRTGPSTFFDVTETLTAGDTFIAVGRVPHNDWVQIEMESSEGETITGWVSGLFVDFDGAIDNLPIVSFPDEQTLRGVVQDGEGAPVNDIGIAVIYRFGGDELRADTTSNEQGSFAVYIPPEFIGVLDVQVVSTGCESRLVDETCFLLDYFELQGRVFIDIPQIVALEILYEKATTFISGTVVDIFGNPEFGVLVVAERDDGAESVSRTDANGQFSSPVGEGIWEIYALIFDPRREGDRVVVNVTNQAPEAIELTSP